MEEILNFIQSELNLLNIPYEFGRWTSEVQYPYFVGEYSEVEPLDESGLEEKTIMLTGWNRGSNYELLKAVSKIKKTFNSVSGKTAILGSGAGIAVFYAGSMPIETGDAELKRMQINLTVKYWSVNNE